MNAKQGDFIAQLAHATNLTIAIFFALLITTVGYSQTGSLEGTIVDNKTGKPLASVNVSLNGTTYGAATTTDGVYQIKNVPAGEYTLELRSIGYEVASREVSIASGETTVVDVDLRSVALAMGEVMVIARRTRVASKAEMSILEIPQAISVLPPKAFEQQYVTTLPEAVRNLSGVIHASTNSGQSENYALRGFYMDSDGNFRRNGIELSKSEHLLNSNAERVELLKGPSSVLYGRLEPGGIINIVTKKPQPVPYYRAQITGGQFSYLEALVDATGPLNLDKNLLYRLNLSYQNRESYRDVVDYSYFFAAPSLAWQPSQETKLLFEGEFKYDRGVTDRGIVSPEATFESLDSQSRSLFLGEKDAEYKRNLITATSTFEHNFNNQFKIQNVLNISNYDREPNSLFYGSLAADGRTLSRTLQYNNQDVRFYFGELNLLGNLKTKGVEHDIAIGVNLQRTNQQSDRRQTAIDPIDIFDPVQTGIPDASTLDLSVDSDQDVDLLGVYLQDRIKLTPKIHALIGFRFTTFDQENRNLLSGNNTNISAEEFTPQYGLVYQPQSWLSVYGSYSESFAPVTFVGSDGEPFEPNFGKQYEIGAKADWLDGAVSTTVALFRLDRSNVLSFFRDSNGVFQVVQGSEQRADGVELDVIGDVTKSLSVVANYNYLDGRVIDDPVFLEGREVGGAPDHTGSLWLNYQLENRIGIGSGIFFQTDWKTFTSSEEQLPGFQTVDAVVSYQISNLVKAQVNFKNIFNERYYLSGAGSNQAYPAAGRTAYLNFSVTR